MKLLIFLLLLLSLFFVNYEFTIIEEPTKTKVTITVKYLNRLDIVEITKGSKIIDLEELYPNINYSSLKYNPLTILHDNDHLDFDIKINSACISINRGSYDELVTLPGIKDALANKIIEYRNKYLFKNTEDIMQVDGIKLAKYNQIKDHICL